MMITNELNVPTANMENLHVLVVDDNLDLTAMLSVLLTQQGCKVSTANDGTSALEMAAEGAPDAVLLDVGLPDFNGFEVARVMRGASWGRDILLVAMTGWDYSAIEARCRAAGFDLHLEKPVDLAKLREILSVALAKKAALGSLD